MKNSCLAFLHRSIITLTFFSGCMDFGGDVSSMLKKILALKLLFNFFFLQWGFAGLLCYH